MKNTQNIFVWYKWILICSISLISVAAFVSCDDDEPEDPNNNNNNTDTIFCFSCTPYNTTYYNVTNGTEVTELNADGLYEIDLGFSFHYCDTSFETLYLPEGLLLPTFTYVLQQDLLLLDGYAVMPFGNILLERTSSSKILTKTIGDSGSKITTIEFSDFVYSAFDSLSQQALCFQLKFYENGNKVVFHYGPNEVVSDFSTSLYAELVLGMSSSTDFGIYLSGDPASPTFDSNSTVALDSWPAEGTLYIFE